ncbi:MAG: hypothetical protein ACK5PF_00685 [bacterium]
MLFVCVQSQLGGAALLKPSAGRVGNQRRPHPPAAAAWAVDTASAGRAPHTHADSHVRVSLFLLLKLPPAPAVAPAPHVTAAPPQRHLHRPPARPAICVCVVALPQARLRRAAPLERQSPC